MKMQGIADEKITREINGNKLNKILVLKDICKIYKTGKMETRALTDINLELEEGEFTAIVGPSGSGKTTLLNIMGGLDIPDSGKIFLHDQEITGLPQSRLSRIRRDKMGFVFQAYNLIPVLNALENVEYVMLLQGISAKERLARSKEILEEVGLKDLIYKRPNEMSGGQQQRVAVARAIVSRPLLVLADEPTANLDSHTSEGLLDMMRNLNEKRGVTFIFSTHDPLVVQRAGRVIPLRDGKLDGEGGIGG